MPFTQLYLVLGAGYTDLFGNIGVTAQTAVFSIDTILPTLSGISIVSSNATNTLAKVGNDITLTFTASETLNADPSVVFTSGNAGVTGGIVITNTSGTTYTAVYTTNANDTDGTIAYAINFTDSAGNDGVQVSGNGPNAVTFDKTAPTISSRSIASNNATDTLAKVDNIVTLTIVASEPISQPTVIFKSGTQGVNDNSITYTGSGTNWTAAYTVHANDTEGTVSYTLNYNDLAGNAGGTISGSGPNAVTVDKTAPTVAPAVSSFTIKDANDSTDDNIIID